MKECQLPVTAPLRATRSRRRKLSTSAIVIIVLAVLVSLAWSYFMPAVPESDAAADGSASDSFEALDALIVTEPTRTNVNDFRAILILESPKNDA